MKPLYVFVMQPFMRSHANTLYDWIKATCDSTNGDFEVIRADDTIGNVPYPRLQDRIDSFIKVSDICIADLTTSKSPHENRNENVLLEVGAAYALQKPVIPITNPSSTLPTDIIGNIYIDLDPESLSNQENIQRMKEAFCTKLRRSLHDSRQFLRRHNPSQFMVYGYDKRSNIDFHSWVRRSVKRIYVLTTNLDFLVHQPFTIDKEEKEMTILEMIRIEIGKKPKDFELRVLTLDPDSNFTNDRAKALDLDRRAFREDLRAHLSTVQDFIISEACVRTARLGVYDACPLQMTFFFDDFVISSVVADGKPSRECVAYLHNLAVGGANETYEPHFQKMWNGKTMVATNRR
jgi:hypothetical protein